MNITITPKKWGEFQHYKDRRPPWIKLQRTLLDDYDFACLPLASRALAPCLWLLASEFEGGHIPADLGLLCFRLHSTAELVIEAVIPLIEKGFFVASAPLAWRKQEARLEREAEREDQKQELPIATQSGAPAPDPIFGTGLDFLRRKGEPEKSARAFLGLLRKELRDDLTVAELLVEAERQDISAPCAWLLKAAKAKKTGPPAAQPGRVMSAVNRLQERKNARLAANGNRNGDAETALLEFGGGPGGGTD